jgi:hypothetical protein
MLRARTSSMAENGPSNLDCALAHRIPIAQILVPSTAGQIEVSCTADEIPGAAACDFHFSSVHMLRHCRFDHHASSVSTDGGLPSSESLCPPICLGRGAE